jgi:hypothetical protein
METLRYDYQHLHFSKCSSTDKTTQWYCIENRSDGIFGTVQWYAPWRQYCFFPDRFKVFSQDYLCDIQVFLNQLMDDHRAAAKNRRSQP